MKQDNREINLVDMETVMKIYPEKEFPQSGFQWSINHIKLDYKGKLSINHHTHH